MPQTEPIERKLNVAEADAGQRLDAFVASRVGVGRRAATRLVVGARVNGRRVPKAHVLAAGDEVALSAGTCCASEEAPVPSVLGAEPASLVLAKPPGLPSVAVVGRAGPSVARWLAAEYPECAALGGPGEAGLVHRLDTGTSGLLLAARSAEAWSDLREQFRRHEIHKEYFAVVEGCVDGSLEIDAPIGQHRKSRTRVRALPPGAHPRYVVTHATTYVSVLQTSTTHSLVAARTTTGARHQIRVHLAHAGHPLVGDVRYGAPPVDGVDYLLHASGIAWEDPIAHEPRGAHLDHPEAWGPILADLGLA